MHEPVRTMLSYLNYHVNIVFVVVFILVGGFKPSSNLLVSLQPAVHCCWLLLCIFAAYLIIISNGHSLKYKKKVESQWASLLAEMADFFRCNTYVYSYILHLSCEDTICTCHYVCRSMCVPISITAIAIVGEIVNTLIFHVYCS